MDRTDSKIDTPVTRGDSRPVRWELIDKDGNVVASAPKVHELGLYASAIFPDQEQDEDRTGAGWDIQIAGLK